MRYEKHDGGKERGVLIGMIVDKVVLAEIADKWTKDGMFASVWANIVGKWCVDFFHKYGEAPNKTILSIFEAWSEQASDKDTIKLVGKFLEDLSGEYTKLKRDSNSRVVIDAAAVLFNRVKLSKVKDKIEGYLELGKVDDAIKSITAFDQVEMGVGAGVDLFTDEKAILSTFEELNEEPVVRYSGALDRFFGKCFAKGTFVAFMGPEKRGKSYWLLDVGYRALTQRRRVAHFECGDLTEKQCKERYLTRASKLPLDSEEGWPLTVEYPMEIEVPEKEGEVAYVRREPRVFKVPSTPKQALQAANRVMADVVKSKSSYFKLFPYPSDTLTVDMVEAKLRQVERSSGWIPDLIVLDYADIMAVPPGFNESRDAVNANWKKLRKLSMQRNCCVVTASQANTASYRTDILEKWNFSEDKRKLAHVTSMIGLNQNKDEEKEEVMRLNFVVRRKGKFHSKRVVHTAMCLALANPCVRSCI